MTISITSVGRLGLRALLLAGLVLPCLPSAAQSDARMGDYTGSFELPGWAPTPATARVIALGNDAYNVQLFAEPQAAAPKNKNLPFAPLALELPGKVTGTSVTVEGSRLGAKWVGGIEDSGQLVLAADGHYGGKFTLTKADRKSPTLGEAPPAGAVVLLPYAPDAAPSLAEWNNDKWQALPDGSMQVGKGNIVSRREFGDLRLHLEFKTPLMAGELGQKRGNSGVFFQDRYEIQVLDSYGVLPLMGDCGAIYNQVAPAVNATLPPGSWQTYDIEFTAPRLAKDGTIEKNPRITVRLNGVLLHQDREIVAPTARPMPPVAKGPLVLQDHGNPVCYRNIWVVEP